MILFVWLLACYTEEAFRDDLDEAVCTWKQDCYAEDPVSCLREAQAARSEIPEGCLFQPDQAQRCVDTVEQMVCEDETEEPGFPEACGLAWDCP